MLSRKYQPVEGAHACLNTLLQSEFPPEVREYGPLAPIIASILSVIIWLIFILFFALFWSRHFSLFQNIVILIVTLCIMGLVIGLIWIIFGVREHRKWVWAWHRW